MPRPPKPTVIKQQLGTMKPERVLQGEFTPILLTKPPPPPDRYRAETKERWKIVAHEMCDAGILHNVDVQILENYCDAYELYLYYRDNVIKKGALVQKHNIYTSQFAVLSKLMLSIGANLGLGAANRTKIGGAAGKSESKLKQLLKSKPA